MKKVYILWVFILALNTLFTTKAWATGPVLSATPSSVAFSAKVGETVEQEVTIKVLNLPLLSTVNSFDVKMEGANGNQFSVRNNATSLLDIVEGLLTGGHKITVSYTPTLAGTHTAEVSVEATLLGLLLPLHLTIPVTATAIPAENPNPAPAVLSSSSGGMDFTTTVNEEANKTTTIRISNLPVPAVLESFNASVTGTGSNHFSLSNVTTTLDKLSTSGQELTVTYRPASAGTHSATLLIEAKLQGMDPIQLSIPLHGSAFDPTPSFNGSLSIAPTNLDLSAQIGETDSELVHISALNLPSLPTLSSFSVKLMGEDKEHFTIIAETQSLENMLSELLSGEYEVLVNYTPKAEGPHSANLVVEATLLNITTVMRVSIPLSGTVIVTPATEAPKVIATTPENEATDVDINTGIILLYDKNVLVVDASKITINGTAVKSAITNGASLYLVPSVALEAQTEYTVLVAPGAVGGEANNPSSQAYSFSFTTGAGTSTTIGMQLLSVSPKVGTAILKKNISDDIILTYTFNKEVADIDINKFIVTGSLTLKSVSIDTENNKVVKVVIGGDVETQTTFTITVNSGACVAADSSEYEGTDIRVYLVVYSPDSGDGGGVSIQEVNPDKIIKAEYIYSVTGAPVNVNGLQHGNIYIRKTVYEDGSVKSQKFIHSRYR